VSLRTDFRRVTRQPRPRAFHAERRCVRLQGHDQPKRPDRAGKVVARNTGWSPRGGMTGGAARLLCSRKMAQRSHWLRRMSGCRFHVERRRGRARAQRQSHSRQRGRAECSTGWKFYPQVGAPRRPAASRELPAGRCAASGRGMSRPRAHAAISRSSPARTRLTLYERRNSPLRARGVTRPVRRQMFHVEPRHARPHGLGPPAHRNHSGPTPAG
jgi:hypothetical protein